ncbi:hypothetical protein D3C86_1973830 [compost metagenome]
MRNVGVMPDRNGRFEDFPDLLHRNFHPGAKHHPTKPGIFFIGMVKKRIEPFLRRSEYLRRNPDFSFGMVFL